MVHDTTLSCRRAYTCSCDLTLFAVSVQALNTKAVSTTVLKLDRNALLEGLAEAIKADPSLASQLESAVKLSSTAR
jgi:hypothetical protein